MLWPDLMPTTQIKFGLTAKIVTLVCGLIVVSMAMMGILSYQRFSTTLVKQELDRLSTTTKIAGMQFVSYINVLRDDVRFLAGIPAVDGVIRAREAGGIDPEEGSTEAIWCQRLGATFARLLTAKRQYRRVRCIAQDDGGREIVRVERVGENIHTIFESPLQASGDDAYFERAFQAKPGTVDLSDVQLAREEGNVVKPHIPIMRAAVAVPAPSGEALGIVVIDLDLRAYFDELVANTASEHTLYVTDPNGNFLVHPNPDKVFGFELGRNDRLEDTFPGLAQGLTPVFDERPHFIQDGPAGRVAVGIHKVFFDPDHLRRFLIFSKSAAYRDVIMASIVTRYEIAVVGVVLVIVAWGAARLISQSLTRPLLQIVQRVETFGEGGGALPLPIRATDEAGVLARSFRQMMKQVSERTASLETEVAQRRKAQQQLREQQVAALRLAQEAQEARKKAEQISEALRESEEKNGAILETAPSAVLTIDADGIVQSINPAAEKTFGYTAQEIVGQNVNQLMPAPYKGQHDSYLAQYLKTGQRKVPGAGREVVGQRKDGTIFPLHLSIGEFKQGGRSFFTGIVQDITDRKKIQVALAQRAKALERSNKELDDFAYIASHDLKEPLRGIHNYSVFLMEDYQDKLDQDGVAKLKTLARLTQRMEGLIDALLHYSRVGRVDLAYHQTDLNQVLEDVVDSLHVTLNERGIEVRIPRSLPAIPCDAARIGEVFRNLIVNAMKYNDKPQKWIEIGYTQNGNASDDVLEANGKNGGKGHLSFYVRDNGIGIREKHIDSVFRIFKRLHGRDQYGGGVGAGLTIVKKIVERHGGRVWVQSQFGDGTTFHFTLQEAA